MRGAATAPRWVAAALTHLGVNIGHGAEQIPTPTLSQADGPVAQSVVADGRNVKRVAQPSDRPLALALGDADPPGDLGDGEMLVGDQADGLELGLSSIGLCHRRHCLRREFTPSTSRPPTMGKLSAAHRLFWRRSCRPARFSGPTAPRRRKRGFVCCKMAFSDWLRTRRTDRWLQPSAPACALARKG